jgi:stage II sporulation protein AB (anti-sigma F factor)
MSDNQFYIRIKDKGCGIADIEQAKTPLFTTCAEGERAGLGFAVMESFMDKLRVYSRVGSGTTITMSKRLITKE